MGKNDPCSSHGMTYAYLMQRRAAQQSDNSQVLRNNNNSIHRFLAVIGKKESDFIEDDFGARFDGLLEKYRAASKADGLADPTISSECSRLRGWRDFWQRERHTFALPVGFAPRFREARQRAGLSFAEIGRAAGLSKAETRYLCVWEKGKLKPRADKSIELIRKIEPVLGLFEGELTSQIYRASFVADTHKPMRGQITQTPSGTKASMTKKLPISLSLPANRWPQHAQGEFDGLKRIKTMDDVAFRMWKALNDPEAERTDYWTVRETAEGEKCATADKVRRHFEKIYGCVTKPVDLTEAQLAYISRYFEPNKPKESKLPAEQYRKLLPCEKREWAIANCRGLGFPVEWCSMALLSDQFIGLSVIADITAYAGVYNGGVEEMLRLYKQLLRAKSGWVWLNEDFLDRLPPDSRGRLDKWIMENNLTNASKKEQWRAWCDYNRKEYINFHKDIKDKITQSRNPVAAVQKYVNRTTSMDFFDDLKAAMLQHPVPDDAPVNEVAPYWNDLVLIAVLADVPLRIRNDAELHLAKSGDDIDLNKSQMWREPDGLWAIRIPRAALKNYRSFKPDAYFARLLPEASRLMDIYVNKYRPMLFGGNDPEGPVFLKAKTPTTKTVEWNSRSLSAKVRKWAVRFLGVSVAGHITRYLNPTELLQLTDGNVVEAAALLGDHPNTMVEFYRKIPHERDVARAQSQMSTKRFEYKREQAKQERRREALKGIDFEDYGRQISQVEDLATAERLLKEKLAEIARRRGDPNQPTPPSGGQPRQ